LQRVRCWQLLCGHGVFVSQVRRRTLEWRLCELLPRLCRWEVRFFDWLCVVSGVSVWSLSGDLGRDVCMYRLVGQLPGWEVLDEESDCHG